jgi:hypothetical protein
MFPYDPGQPQGQFPSPGNSGAPGGPLDGIQDQVAAVLNGNGDRPNVYIPGGPGEPVFQVPNIRIAIIPAIMRLFRRA